MIHSEMIKRSDGTAVGRSVEEIKKSQEEVRAQQQSKKRQKVSIADLIPYEASVVKPALVSAKKKHAAGGCTPPHVVDVDGRLLVLDGTHRVRAALDAGETEMEIDVQNCLEKDRERYSKTIALRDKEEATFAKLPEDDDDEQRRTRTAEELKKMGEP